MVRSNNQDAAFSFFSTSRNSDQRPDFGLFMVADGMGGHTDGELASAVTVQTLAHRIVGQIVMPLLEGHQPSADQKTIAEVMADAMDAANDAVQIQVPSGGTTATCVVIRGDLAYISHVGDSRAYLVTNRLTIEAITRDHSLVRRLQELGQLSAKDAENHPQRNVLYRAIGQGDNLEVDASVRRLPPGSQLMLCSDGLWGLVDESRMLEIIRENPDPQEACFKLVDEANLNGGPDNITVILVNIPE